MAYQLISTSTNVVRFSSGPHGWLQTTLAVQNHSTETIIYRLKTTSPNDYYGTPTLAALQRGDTVQLKLCRRPFSPTANTRECMDKFLLLAAPISAAAREIDRAHQQQLSSSDLAEVWKSIPSCAHVKRRLHVIIVGQRPAVRRGGIENENRVGNESTTFTSSTAQVVSNDNNDHVIQADDGGVANNVLQFLGRRRVHPSGDLPSLRVPGAAMITTPTMTMTLPTANTTTTTSNNVAPATSHHIGRTAETVRTRMRAVRLSNTSRATQQSNNAQSGAHEPSLRAVRMGTEIGSTTNRLNSPLIRVMGRVRAIVPSHNRNTAPRNSSTHTTSPSFPSSLHQEQQQEDITVMAGRFTTNTARHSSDGRRGIPRELARRISRDRRQVARIPVKPLPSFSPTDAHVDIQCPICLEPLVNDTLSAPPCSHTMHARCLRAWNTRYGCINCPVCRYTEPVSMPTC